MYFISLPFPLTFPFKLFILLHHKLSQKNICFVQPNCWAKAALYFIIAALQRHPTSYLALLLFLPPSRTWICVTQRFYEAAVCASNANPLATARVFIVSQAEGVWEGQEEQAEREGGGRNWKRLLPAGVGSRRQKASAGELNLQNRITHSSSSSSSSAASGHALNERHVPQCHLCCSPSLPPFPPPTYSHRMTMADCEFVNNFADVEQNFRNYAPVNCKARVIDA